MNARATPSAAEQRLQALVVAGVIATFVWVDQLGALVALAAMALFWPPAAGWRPLAARRVLTVYPPFALVWLGITIGYLQLMYALGAPVTPQDGLERLAREGVGHPELPAALLQILVFAPVFEEIVFRGYLFGALRTLLPSLATQLVTALLFGLAHTWQYALPIGFLALLFGWLRARYDALLPAILAHALHNGLTVGVTLLWPQTLDWMYPR